MGRDAEVLYKFKHSCVHHFLNMPGSHSDFTSLLAHSCDWSPLFTTEEGAFLRTTIVYFELVGRWDFAKVLRTLLGLHFMDNSIIHWLVNSNLVDPQCRAYQEICDNSFCHTITKVHVLILHKDPWYCTLEKTHPRLARLIRVQAFSPSVVCFFFFLYNSTFMFSSFICSVVCQVSIQLSTLSSYVCVRLLNTFMLSYFTSLIEFCSIISTQFCPMILSSYNFLCVYVQYKLVSFLSRFVFAQRQFC